MASEVGPQLQTVVRVALGLIFLVSAAAKLRDPSRFVRGVLAYALLRGSLARLYGRMLPFVELGTALLLATLAAAGVTLRSPGIAHADCSGCTFTCFDGTNTWCCSYNLGTCPSAACPNTC
jgi:hypothetical protein